MAVIVVEGGEILNSAYAVTSRLGALVDARARVRFAAMGAGFAAMASTRVTTSRRTMPPAFRPPHRGNNSRFRIFLSSYTELARVFSARHAHADNARRDLQKNPRGGVVA